MLDPFIGSGTTAICAQLLNRNWMGFDLNPVYIDMAIERMDLVFAAPEPKPKARTKRTKKEPTSIINTFF